MENDAERLHREVVEMQKTFSEITYRAMTSEERIQWWFFSTHDGMRAQGEWLGDEYTEFDEGWYAHAKSMEPDFDRIFRLAMKRMDHEFDWNRYHERIGVETMSLKLSRLSKKRRVFNVIFTLAVIAVLAWLASFIWR